MKSNKLIEVFNLRPDKQISDKARVFDVGGVAPTILATHYKDPPKILEKKTEIIEVGNLKEGQQSWDSPQTGRVYSTEGICPTLNTCGGGGHEVKIVEKKVLGGIYTDVSEDFNRGLYPNMSRTLKATKNDAGVIERQVVAMRGRNPDNPSDRTAGSPTEQRLEPNSDGICNTLTSVCKDNMILERKILTPKRTEYGKAIRKQYESGEISESRHNMTELTPRDDGLCNTITTVQKDNLLMEYVKIKQANKEGYIKCRIGGAADFSYPESDTRRGRVIDDGNVCPTLMASNQDIVIIETQYRVRKLTAREQWRIMGFSDEDYEKAAEVNSKTQLYKQSGNSIVRDVLMAIFSQLNIKGVPMWNEVHHGTK